jgi:hypothetical protein
MIVTALPKCSDCSIHVLGPMAACRRASAVTVSNAGGRGWSGCYGHLPGYARS